jgi:hypothetical protein
MTPKHVFKTKTFDRWAKNLVNDQLLCAAAREIEQGLFEGDLGRGLCKKRVAIPGQGKSGSTRTLVAKRHPLAIFFLFGREKSAPGHDFPDALVEVAKLIATKLQSQKVEKLDELAANGELKEICNGPKEQ